MSQFALAYGSLVADLPGKPFVRKVRGLRRQWGVAMDNRVDLPGYKFYVRAGKEERHEGHVAFLDLVEAPGGALNGVLFEVDPGQLDAIDRRERNYARADVTSNVVDPPGRVVAYTGTEAGQARFAAGVAAGDLVVCDAYYERVRAAFDARGELEDFESTTGPLPCPVARLTRIDL